MKIVAKKDLVMMDGFLVNKKTNEVVVLSGLADEFNELNQYKEILDFVKANKKAILNSETKPVLFKLSKPETPVLKSDKVVKTPLSDEDKAKKIALAEEFMKSRHVEDINDHLAYYKSMATWFSKDAFVYQDQAMTNARFFSDITTWTEKDVIQIIEDYHDAEFVKLRDMLKYDYS